ncbi:MAG TPA: hypothetical protein VM243_04710 [Phycisphaerae bacterium]|nr:hypothetical protein [Phycisphaerae bacterium]
MEAVARMTGWMGDRAAAEAERAQEQIAASAKSVFESTRTSQERFAERIRELGNLLGRQLIDWDTYRRAVKSAMDALPAGAAGARRTVEQLGAGQNVASERMSAMFAIREENLRKRDEDKEKTAELKHLASMDHNIARLLSEGGLGA